MKPSSDTSPTSGRSVASRTAVLLEGTSSYFDRLERERSQKLQAFLKPIPGAFSPGPRGLRRTFGLAPWHRNESHESILSATSSVHKLLIGDTPAPTPGTVLNYTDGKGKTYPKSKRSPMWKKLSQEILISCH